MTTVESVKGAATDPGGELRATFDRQLRGFLQEGAPSLEVRINRLDRLAAAMLDAADDLALAIRADFGNRPIAASLAGDIATTVREIEYTRRHLKTWLKPTRPQPRYMRLAGIKAWVEPQPLGVVGVIAPWNFPVALAMQPAAAAISAGNRVMVKMSERTAATAEVVAQAIAAEFTDDVMAVVTGDAAMAAAFSELPFDHIFFTGATAIGKNVQRAAAENLVPVTLELGGKNPAVVSHDADINAAARRAMSARLANSGQVCLCPDYAFVPRAKVVAFVDACAAHVRTKLASITANPDYCTIINDAHFARIVALVADAREKGAVVTEIVPSHESLPDPTTRTIAPTLVVNVDDTMKLMHEEVFGPVLAILPYDSIDEVVEYVNSRPNPLAAYWFGEDSADFRRFRQRTRSGGVTRNDFALHSALDGLPFGGVGASGTGYYHGKYGFDTFSHLRAVAESPSSFSPVSVLTPPFPARLESLTRRYLRWQQRKFHNRIASSRR